MFVVAVVVIGVLLPVSEVACRYRQGSELYVVVAVVVNGVVLPVSEVVRCYRY